MAGSYTLTLKVTNTAGFANSASTTFTVPPTLVIGGPYSGRPGLPLQFTSSASEPGRVTTYTYAWQFGDGGTSNVENPQHTYSAAGTYNVSVAVDANGNAWIPSTTLVEANAAGGTLASYPVSDSVQGGGAAIDGKSDVWFTAPEDNSIVEVGPSGNLISTASGATGGGLSVPSAIALDNAGGVWAINTHNNSLYYGMSISKIAANGTPAAGSPFDGGDLNIPYSLAVDGSGNVWVANTYAFEPSGSYISVIELKPGGSEAMSISYGGGLNQNMGSPQALALDSAGDVWMANGGSVTVTEFIGASTPVVTPLSANLAAPYGAPASRP